jgi:NAD(P)-dependent dehydrogenase (short-subunit alcohol dehydrogenase family)
LTRALRDPAAFEKEMLDLFRVNAIGSAYLLATFMPLMQNGDLKKVVVLSTGMGDPDFIAETKIDSQSPYAISKAALNMVIAKYHAEYSKQGILIMGISPGIVETGWQGSESKPSPHTQLQLHFPHTTLLTMASLQSRQSFRRASPRWARRC